MNQVSRHSTSVPQLFVGVLISAGTIGQNMVWRKEGTIEASGDACATAPREFQKLGPGKALRKRKIAKGLWWEIMRLKEQFSNTHKLTD